MSNRRNFIQKAFGLGAGLFVAPTLFADSQNGSSSRSRTTHPGPAFNMSVVTTDIGDMPYTMDGNTKVFHLTAEVVKQKISPLKTIDAWGFNGSAPGPTIQVSQGDHVRVVFENRLDVPLLRRSLGSTNIQTINVPPCSGITTTAWISPDRKYGATRRDVPDTKR